MVVGVVVGGGLEGGVVVIGGGVVGSGGWVVGSGGGVVGSGGGVVGSGAVGPGGSGGRKRPPWNEVKLSVL